METNFVQIGKSYFTDLQQIINCLEVNVDKDDIIDRLKESIRLGYDMVITPNSTDDITDNNTLVCDDCWYNTVCANPYKGAFAAQCRYYRLNPVVY